MAAHSHCLWRLGAALCILWAVVSATDGGPARCSLQLTGTGPAAPATTPTLKHFELRCQGGTIIAALAAGGADQAAAYKNAHPENFAGVDWRNPDESPCQADSEDGTEGRCLLTLCNGTMEFGPDSGINSLTLRERWTTILCVQGGANVTFSGTSITNNAAAVVIRAYTNTSSLALHDCKLRGNRPTRGRNPALVGINNSTLRISNTQFADNDGPAVRATNASKVYARQSVWDGNRNNNDACGGPAITANNALLEVQDCVFERNVAECDAARGGAVRLIDANATFANSSFSFNNATGPVSRGGALYVFSSANSSATLQLQRGSTLSNNTAELGGGLAACSGTLDAQHSSFANNSGLFSGGAIFLAGSVQATLADSVLEHNSAATDGGAVFAQWTDSPGGQLQLKVSASRLQENAAQQGSGGAIFVQGGVLDLGGGTVMRSNRAARDGGAVFITAQPDANNVTNAPACARLELDAAPGVEVTGNNATRAGGGFAIGGSSKDCVEFSIDHLRQAVRWSDDVAYVPTNDAAFSDDILQPDHCETGWKWHEGVCIECANATFSINGDPFSTCKPCPPGAACQGRVVNVTRGHFLESSLPDWPEKSENFSAFQCPNPAACTTLTRHNTRAFEAGMACNSSIGYAGPLCGSCLPNFTQPVPFTCELCGTVAGNRAWLAGISCTVTVLLWLLWIAAWVGNDPAAHLDGVFFEWSDAIKVLLWYAQALTAIGRFWVFSGSDDAPACTGCTDQLRSLFRVLASVFSLNEFVARAYCLMGPKPALLPGYSAAALTCVLPLGFFLSVLVLHLLVRLLALALRRAAVHMRLLAADGAAAAGAAAAGIDAAGRRQQSGECKRSRTQRVQLALHGALHGALGLDEPLWQLIKERLPLLCATVLYFFYPSWLRFTFGMFACVPVTSKPRGTAYWLFAMGEVACRGAGQDTSRFNTINRGVGGVLIALFIFCVPLLPLIIKPTVPKGELQAARVRSYFYKVFRSGCYFWEGLLQLRLVFFIGIAVFSPILGPVLSLVLLGLTLAAYITLHAAVKPHIDFMLHHLTIMAYSALLLTVVGALLAFIDFAARESKHLDPAWLHANIHKEVFRKVVGGCMIAFNALFAFYGLLVIISLVTRGKRGQPRTEQLCQHGNSGWLWLWLSLGFGSKLRLPIAHRGLWNCKGDTARPPGWLQSVWCKLGLSAVSDRGSSVVVTPELVALPSRKASSLQLPSTGSGGSMQSVVEEPKGAT